MSREHLKKPGAAWTVRWFFMPYCIRKLPDGRSIILNKRNKPVGTLSDDEVEYGTHPDAMKLALTPELETKLSWNGCGADAEGCIYLYSNTCVPTASEAFMDAYLRRVAVLMTLRVSL